MRGRRGDICPHNRKLIPKFKIMLKHSNTLPLFKMNPNTKENQTMKQNRSNYLIPIQFQLMTNEKSKTYLVNTNWTIEEFIKFIKYQLYLDSDYYGIDIEKQQEIDFVPCFSKSCFDLSYFHPMNQSYCYNDYEKYNPLKPSCELFKYYFDYNYPSSFKLSTKIQNIYYPYY